MQITFRMFPRSTRKTFSVNNFHFLFFCCCFILKSLFFSDPYNFISHRTHQEFEAPRDHGVPRVQSPICGELSQSPVQCCPFRAKVFHNFPLLTLSALHDAQLYQVKQFWPAFETNSHGRCVNFQGRKKSTVINLLCQNVKEKKYCYVKLNFSTLSTFLLHVIIFF